MIRQQEDLFVLETRHTSLLLRVIPTGHLEQVYYGERLSLSGGYSSLLDPPGVTAGSVIAYSPSHPIVMENLCLAYGTLGHGDLRQPAMVVETERGTASDLRFVSAEITPGLPDLAELPAVYAEDGSGACLSIHMADSANGLAVTLFWAVLEDCDVICRWATLTNQGEHTVTLRRLMSNQLDLDAGDYELLTWKGNWGREMSPCVQPVTPGRLVNESLCGTSSNRANPFVVLKEREATETAGVCYGFHLLYSGNHLESVEENSFGRVRLLQGIHPQGFSWQLAPGDSFTCPQAAMACSTQGIQGLRQSMHTLIRNHIVRGEWKHKPRPVLINSWESFYFRFNEGKLLRLAKEAQKLGIELFVLDDGWFGQRDDDTSSLGDWQVDQRKLPGGLSGLCDKINQLGMDFGLWVEPEAVNICSELYRTHPDWILGPVDQSDGRNELLLDLGQTQVQDWMIDTLTQVFSSCNLSYVKWDMNRIFSDTFSQKLPLHRQGEVAHRYLLGLYRVLREINARFPHILFEGCASGGNRFDCGMLCYFPQIWASDNTDALCRYEIQDGYYTGYPQSTMGCHVSTVPNHQTLRTASLESRFQVACFGVLGYELDLSALTGEERSAIAAQVAFYKARRTLFQYGQLYRRMSPSGAVWTVAAEDGSAAATLLFCRQAKTNSGLTRLPVAGLDPQRVYHFTVRQFPLELRRMGSMARMLSPLAGQANPITDAVAAKLVKVLSEPESHTGTGQVLMQGVKLSPAFCGIGYHDGVRVMLDYDSRLYLMDSAEE